LEYLPTPHLKEDLPRPSMMASARSPRRPSITSKGDVITSPSTFHSAKRPPIHKQLRISCSCLIRFGRGFCGPSSGAYSTGYAVLTSAGCVQSSDFPRSTGHGSRGHTHSQTARNINERQTEYEWFSTPLGPGAPLTAYQSEGESTVDVSHSSVVSSIDESSQW
jgi:hypothetical protein